MSPGPTDILAVLPERGVGAGGGKKAAEGGVKGTGEGKGRRRVGTPHPPPLPPAERLTEKA